MDSALWARSEYLYLLCVSEAKRLFGEDHLVVVSSLSNLAGLYRDSGFLQKSIKLLEEAEKISRTLESKASELRFTIVNNLALAYADSRQYDKAEILYKKIIPVDINVPQSKQEAITLNNLGLLYRDTCRYAEAKYLLDIALEYFMKHLGPWDSHTLTGLRNFADLQKSVGDIRDSQKLYEIFLQVAPSVLGDSSPLVLETRGNVANLYQEIGEIDRAENLYIENIETYENSYTVFHSGYVINLIGLADLYVDRGNFPSALSNYKYAFNVIDENLGGERSWVALKFEKLATLHREMSQLIKAEILQKNCLSILDESPHKNRFKIAHALNGLGGEFASFWKILIQQKMPTRSRLRFLRNYFQQVIH